MRTVGDAGPYKTNLNFVRKQTYKQEFTIDFSQKANDAAPDIHGTISIDFGHHYRYNNIMKVKIGGR